MRLPEIAGWVRRRREEIGLSRAEVEMLSGVSVSTIRRIEDGKSVNHLALDSVVESLGAHINLEETGGNDTETDRGAPLA